MNSFHIKSTILGIGIGIILTSVISLIYLAGREPEKILSDEEIIERAAKLGMVSKDDFFKIGVSDTSNSPDNTAKDTSSSDNTDTGSQPETTVEGSTDSEENDAVKADIENTTADENTGSDSAGISSENTETSQKEVKLKIVSGDTSEKVAVKLKDLGLIGEKEEFVKEVNRRKLSEKINIGEYIISEGTSLDGIIRMITENG